MYEVKPKGRAEFLCTNLINSLCILNLIYGKMPCVFTHNDKVCKHVNAYLDKHHSLDSHRNDVEN